MESTVFTGFNEVMKVPTSPTVQTKPKTAIIPPSNLPTSPANENNPTLNIPTKNQSKIVRIRLRLKNEQVDQERLQQLSDKFTFKPLGKGFTQVEALIEERCVKMFQTIFKGSNVGMEITPVT